MAITANKFKGIRAAVCHDCYSCERSVLSNNCNVICMGERVIGHDLAENAYRPVAATCFCGQLFHAEGAGHLQY